MSSENARPSQTLRLLAERLESASALTDEMRQGLLRGESETIDAATARLQTVATECRILEEELRRIADRPWTDPEWEQAHLEFERMATRLARHGAIHGGMLHGLVHLTRRLLEAFGDVRGDGYSRSGRAPEAPFEGLHLEELA